MRLIEKPIYFTVFVDRNLPALLIGDEVRIRQILLNLLNNAVKYTEDGSISLTVTGEVDGNMALMKISVTDTGIGIKEQDIDKLFKDFVQVDVVKNKSIEGTGLGLAIAHNLCLAMGGNICVTSEYGKGSTFTVTLPQKFESFMPFAAVDKAEEKSVLLYETRQAYRDSIARSLGNLGVHCKSVENIPELFNDLEKYPYLLVSSFAYASVNPVLQKLKNPPKLVIVADITESMAPRDAITLAMPAHSLSIANILEGIYEVHTGTAATGASFTAPGARVLVVDDIAANLKVSEGLLSPYEMQVTLCMSGRESVELVAGGTFDLVFMDHMMPDVDGLEATRLIRAMDGEYFRSLPIIALTANAVSGVREMYVQNGMNDFLAKPIETVKLNSILERWIPAEKRKKIQAVEQPAESSEFVDMLRREPELSVDRALATMGGSVKLYEKSVRLSVRLIPENIARLESLLDTDLKDYAIEVHGVKGVLNNIGAYGLGKTAYKLETESKNGDLDVCKQVHPEFIEKLAGFSDRMSALMSQTEVTDKPEGDRALLLETLEKLTAAAEYYDAVLALEILTAVNQYTYGREQDEAIESLARAFERFDFDEAAGLIEKLKG